MSLLIIEGDPENIKQLQDDLELHGWLESDFYWDIIESKETKNDGIWREILARISEVIKDAQ